ncbi:MAG: hypothetical protein A2138_25600 [Deltaproteobacteria bacterium RBG_16_71_12]|nr:MAG: hypothetical protein A2138_25600 [Deltaproteobacteria bacterium RBG_16_71_12]
MSPSTEPTSAASRVWLVVILAALAALKVAYSLNWSFPAGADGGYYTDIVQHLLAGDGLVTDVSLYHRAFRSFPHADSIYPLWPLCYAAAAALFPLEKVGVWLPSALYLTSLGTAFLWARRLVPGDLFRRVPGFGAGHVLVLLLGLHGAYFIHTSRPYTEGLAYALLFLCCWRAMPLLQRRTTTNGLELGAWLGVLLLVRSQLVIVPAALAGALLVGLALAREQRRELVVFCGAVGAGASLLLLPYALYLAANSDGFSVWNYLLFGETPEASPLSQARPYVRPDGVGHLRVLAHGVATAFAWGVNVSYRGSYHLFHYSLPIALVLGGARLARVLRDADGRARTVAWLRDPKNAHWIMFALLAVLGFLSVQLLVKNEDRWYFHRRHNLVALPLFYFSLLALLRSRALPLALVGVVLLVGSVGIGARRVGFEIYKTDAAPRVPSRQSVVDWINAERARLGRPLVVASSAPQVMVWRTPGVAYHEVNAEITTLDDVLVMFDQLGADYLVSPLRDEVRHRQPRQRFDAELEMLPGVELGRLRVYRRRRAIGAEPNAPAPFVGAPDAPDDTDDL